MCKEGLVNCYLLKYGSSETPRAEDDIGPSLSAGNLIKALQFLDVVKWIEVCGPLWWRYDGYVEDDFPILLASGSMNELMPKSVGVGLHSCAVDRVSSGSLQRTVVAFNN